MKVHGVITSFEEAQQIIGKIRERRIPGTLGIGPYRQEYYRGQLSNKWDLKPGIARKLSTAAEINAYEQKIMSEFSKKMEDSKQLHKLLIHKDPVAFQNDWSMLSQAQHYGIPTRLMDWTLSAEVGLYFAVDNPALDDQDGQFFVIYVPQEKIQIDGNPTKGYYHSPVNEVKGTLFINPSFYSNGDLPQSIAETRRARQHGKFTLQDYDTCIIPMDQQAAFNHDYFSYPDTVIEKYLIPAAYKAQLRLDLISRGYDGEFLYAGDDADINMVRDECRGLIP